MATRQTKEISTIDTTSSLSLAQMRRQSWAYAIGCSLLSMLVFAGGGWGLDLLLDKKPIFTIIGFVLAFVATLIELVVIGQKKFK